jgi:hypothetical protein
MSPTPVVRWFMSITLLSLTWSVIVVCDTGLEQEIEAIEEANNP